jgi:hypothetical protein
MLCLNKLSKYITFKYLHNKLSKYITFKYLHNIFINDLPVGIYYRKGIRFVCIISQVRKIYFPKIDKCTVFMHGYKDKKHLIYKSNCIHYIYDKFIAHIIKIVDKKIIIYDRRWNLGISYLSLMRFDVYPFKNLLKEYDSKNNSIEYYYNWGINSKKIKYPLIEEIKYQPNMHQAINVIYDINLNLYRYFGFNEKQQIICYMDSDDKDNIIALRKDPASVFLLDLHKYMFNAWINDRQFSN